MANSAKYQKLDHREHVLKRPQMYIGNINNVQIEDYIYENNIMTKKQITYNSGILKIFDEVLVNAIDHCVRDRSVTFIDVKVKDNEEITISNDGNDIPDIVMDETHGIYIPELIFGNLLSSSNYDDDKERIVGGLNGLGAKLTNIFSTKFEVFIEKGNMRYKQVFSQNMSKKSKPHVKEIPSKKKNIIKFTFKPDFSKFGIECIDDQTLAMLKHRVFEASACTRKNIIVKFNNEKIQSKDFMTFAKLFTKDIVIHENERWKVAVAKSMSGTFECISFVNGIRTYNNGTHVDNVITKLIKKLTEELKRKNKNDVNIRSNYIKDNMFVIVNSTISNPSFSSQDKERLITKSSQFGSTFNFEDTHVKKIIKLGVLDDVLRIAEIKDIDKANKAIGTNKKRSRILIENFDDAIYAGSKKSNECTLILCEGLSAKSMVMSSFGIISRQLYGVYPLKGKILNVRDTSTKKIIENKEIQDICKILGLSINDRDKTEHLRYGRIIIMTDSDVDGFHIKSLLLNLFNFFWNKDTIEITSLLTPIVKCLRNNNSVEFYDIDSFEQWKKTLSGRDLEKYKIKYYKGLGSSTKNEAQQYFRDMKLLSYKVLDDEKDYEKLELGFRKNRSNDRKKWILDYSNMKKINDANSVDANTGSDYFKQGIVSVHQCIDNELIQYSMDNITRSIPSAVDGLKQSQRKILYAGFKKNLNSEIKVSQFSGYVSEQTSYHHGEMSLNETIIGMAQTFVGSNNINLFEPVGQFGSRINNGSDHASPRYIFTMLNPILRKKYFIEHDDKIITYLNDDGFKIEPEFYIPTLPFLLINGSIGIATGFSTNIPCFNPDDIVRNIKLLNEGKEMNEMTPWYKGFKGSIRKIDFNKWQSEGVLNVSTANVITVTELPIGTSIENYKEFLTKQELENKIISFENYSTDTDIHFEIKVTATFIQEKHDQLLRSLNLVSNINATNMHALGKENEIIKFNTAEDILLYHYNIRKEYYAKRKEFMLNVYKNEIRTLKNKRRFIEAVMNENVVVFRRNRADIVNDMKEQEFYNIDDLLNMKIHTFSNEKIQQLDHQITQKRDERRTLKNITIEQIWLNDLEN
ncbi:putative DNA topoisomerase II [Heterosigma akashiwo virus 01]|uniref:DNA topoisomerase 2 n=1 Tax=Heterosigma akashiwo virus 01 TaxID=97195 RepID=A0A1C9C544_HAV01|nr:DNA topoisomerase II large subunit [Heterosigma akashiwo virus 01]AOM63407.1 putative DNA topoisomerase II [Heterosigma akashiwo virus 01]